MILLLVNIEKILYPLHFLYSHHSLFYLLLFEVYLDVRLAYSRQELLHLNHFRNIYIYLLLT